MLVLTIALVLALSLVAAWGWGSAVGRLLGTKDAIISPVWTGLAIVSLLVTSLHLFVPLAQPLALLLLITGLLFALISSAGSGRKINGALVACGLLSVAFTALLFSGDYLQYDTGLYHLQTVFWNQLQPVTPGLSNLHGRLGVNSSATAFATLFQSLPGGSQHYAVGVWVAAALFEAFCSLRRLWIAVRDKAPLQVSDPGWVVLLPALAILRLDYQLPSLSTDIPPLIASVPLLIILLAGSRRQQLSLADLAVAGVLATLVVTQKLSQAVFSAACLVMIFVLVKRQIPEFWRLWRNWLPALLFCSLAMALWMCRAVVLSGYPLFPSPVLGLNVDWRTPQERVALESAWITSWARVPNASLEDTAEFSRWFPRWVRRIQESLTIIVPLVLVLAAGIVLLLQKPSLRISRHMLTVLIPFCLGAVYWFLSAPDPRFALILFWGFPFCALSFLRPRAALRAAGIIVISAVILLLAMQTPATSNFIQTYRYLTDSGLAVLVPVSSDRCFDAPLPCTPYPDPFLQLRGDSMREGFRLGS